jgi:hypothetical protein
MRAAFVLLRVTIQRALFPARAKQICILLCAYSNKAKLTPQKGSRFTCFRFYREPKEKFEFSASAPAAEHMYIFSHLSIFVTHPVGLLYSRGKG